MRSGDFEAELTAGPEAVPRLRHAVRAHLRRECPDVELAVSELLGNVVRHVGTGTPVTLRVTGAGGTTRVEVTDRAPAAVAAPRSPSPDEESGRGLALLEALATRWGVVRGTGSKTVWCELDGS
ncbi:ATP-binding protein [Streptomyces sp. t39]|uniref:ATP-binding protein n=1 Tax=Streptomyces sp. t39 TaxID=1828156 RepID=UPI0011CDFCFC|nr:ATP-binding protein [Streptomyces sp. t39]TXS51236.1 ATP-binding protein [Streptomyces sp. t39]